MPTQDDILHALSRVQDPDLKNDIVSLGFIQNLQITGADVQFDINLTTPSCPVKDKLKAEAEGVVSGVPGVEKVTVNMTANVRRSAETEKAAIKDVRNFILIASGKGGVGKSTVAANVAVALARAGSKVGLLDADIYGPTIPFLLGPAAPLQIKADEVAVPPIAHGVKFLSMGFLAPGDKPLIWRGPMAHHALQKCLFQTEWGELDYLLLDLPPGTGDVHLTTIQSLPVTGAVLVSTPQEVGVTVSLKTYQMFKTTNIRILGFIENMSHHICSHCGAREDIFGHGGMKAAAERLGVPFLGKIPLDQTIRERSDDGRPIVLDSASQAGLAYRVIAEKLAAQISLASFEIKEKIVELVK